MNPVPGLVVVRPEIEGSAGLLVQALERIRDDCQGDPLAETNGDGIAEDILESFHTDRRAARFLLLVGAVDGQVVGHAVGRIDPGYEGRRHCTLGYFKLEKGYRWRLPIVLGMRRLEEWAAEMGCSELRISTYSQAHVRLYRMKKYGGFEPLFVTLTRSTRRLTP